MAVFCPTHNDSELPEEREIEEYRVEENTPSTSSTGTKKKRKRNKKKNKTDDKLPGDLMSRRSAVPPFDSLPVDNDLNLFYYAESYFGTFCRARNWVFMGEITNNDTAQIPFLRNRVLVKDRDGRSNIPICFYPTSGTFSFNTLKLGHTIAVLLAEQHYFLDLTIGLRIEALDSIKVIPCSLNDLMALSKHYSSSTNKCWGCGQEREPVSLKKCGACKTARYCNQTCQREDWGKRHKKWCKVIPDFLFLSSIDYKNPDSLSFWR